MIDYYSLHDLGVEISLSPVEGANDTTVTDKIKKAFIAAGVDVKAVSVQSNRTAFVSFATIEKV